MENNQHPVNPQPDQNLSLQIPSSPKKLRVPMIALSGILLLGIGLLSGYFIFSPKTPLQPNSNQKVQTSPVITIELSPTKTISPTSSTSNWETHTTAQLKGISFKPYSISYPKTWTKNIIREEGLETLTLAKEKHMILIDQGAFGGSGCIFEGETPEGSVIDLRGFAFTELQSGIGTFRRYEIDMSKMDPKLSSFGFCALANETYQSHSQVGSLRYIVPNVYNDLLINEMDSIIKTLRVIN